MEDERLDWVYASDVREAARPLNEHEKNILTLLCHFILLDWSVDKDVYENPLYLLNKLIGHEYQADARIRGTKLALIDCFILWYVPTKTLGDKIRVGLIEELAPSSETEEASQEIEAHARDVSRIISQTTIPIIPAKEWCKLFNFEEARVDIAETLLLGFEVTAGRILVRLREASSHPRNLYEGYLMIESPALRVRPILPSQVDAEPGERACEDEKAS